MTLSRWDTQSSLWAFGNKSTPYQRAFWHPGVGMWQFDSAGGCAEERGEAVGEERGAGHDPGQLRHGDFDRSLARGPARQQVAHEVRTTVCCGRR